MNNVCILVLLCFVSFKIFSQVEFNNLAIEKYEGLSCLPVSDTVLLENLLRIPSFSGKEAELGQYLMNICEQTGLQIRQFGDQDGNFNFAASLYDLNELKPNLIFLNHLDVSPIGTGSRWIHPPFDGRTIDGEIWGRGAFDNKGGAVIQLSALAHFVETSKNINLPFNITFLSTSCEETQCEGGIRYVVEHYFDILNPWLVIGEGPPGLDSIVSSKPDMTVFSIAIGQKKTLWLKLELNIRTNGHSSVPPASYANQEMIRSLSEIISEKNPIIYTRENKTILMELGKLEKGIKGFALRHPILFKPLIKPQIRKRQEFAALFTNTTAITGISNTSMIQNAIPEKITCLLDCRLLPGTKTESFISGIRKKIKNDAIQIEKIFETPDAKPTSRQHPAFQMLSDAITRYYGESTPVIPIILPNFTDGTWFRNKGVPVFEITPVKMKRTLMKCIHGIDERIPLDAISSGREVFKSFINGMIVWAFRP